MRPDTQRWRSKPHAWHTARNPKRRFLFWRFAMVFGFMWLMFVAALVLVSLAYLALRPATGDFIPELLIVCSIPFVFTLLIFILGRWAFSRIGAPLVDVMAAADAVAEGDLDVQVRENMPGEYGRLARSFNRMTARLRTAEQQRRSLTADVAHELRTPLHIVQGNLEGILDGVYQPDEAHINATLEETRLLSRLIEDLQTLSLAESGALPLHRSHVPVGDLLSDVLTSFSAQAESTGIAIELDLPAEPNDMEVYVDVDRMDQVLSILVVNALRHTPSGGRITLAAARLSDEVRLTVADDGVGILPEDLPYVFDRFWVGERSRSRQAGAGSGLGLAIVRQLVQAHQGIIQVESQPGHGTTFTIILPCDRQASGKVV